MGALALSGQERAFGGLSGLLIEPDGRLLAVTDQAHWFAARMQRDAAGRLTGLADATLTPMRDGNGAPLRPGRAGDSESLARLADGRLLVGFERWHRIRAFASPQAPGVFLPHPAGITTLPANAGLEALTVLDDGRLLAIAEATGPDGTSPAWIGTGDGAAWDARRYLPGPGLSPVDAAGLPGGGALVLERSVSLLTGFACRIAWLPPAALGLPVLAPADLATLAPPLLSDNYEAIAVAQRPDGMLDVALASDDNFSLFQRSILMLLRLDPAALRAG
jgi:YD repeat-containing protein